MIKFVGEIGGNILNGVINGDREGEFTYVDPRGSSVIDYIVVNDNCYEIVNNFKVANGVDSDHMPIIMITTAEAAGIKEDLGEEITGNVRRYETCWSRNDIRQYTERTNDKQWEEREYGNSIEEMWDSLKSLVNENMIKKEYRKVRRKIGYKD